MSPSRSLALAALLTVAMVAVAVGASAQTVSISGSVEVRNATLTLIVYSDGGVQLAYHAGGTASITLPSSTPIPANISVLLDSRRTVNRTSLEAATMLTAKGLRLEKLSVAASAVGNVTWGPGVEATGWVYVRLPLGEFNASYRLAAGSSVVTLTLSGVDCRISKLLEGLVPGLNATCKSHVLRARLDLGRFYAWLRAKGVSDAEIEALNTLLTRGYRVHGSYRLNLTLEKSVASYSYVERLQGGVAKLVVDQARAEYPIYHVMVVVLHRLAEKLGEEKLASQLARAEQALALLAAPPKLLPKPPYRSHLRLTLKPGSNGSYEFNVDYLSEKMVYAAGGLPPAALAEKTIRVIAENLLQLRMALSLLSAYVKGVDGLLPYNVTLKPGDRCVEVKPTTATLDQLQHVTVRVSCSGRGGRGGGAHGAGKSAGGGTAPARTKTIEHGGVAGAEHTPVKRATATGTGTVVRHANTSTSSRTAGAVGTGGGGSSIAVYTGVGAAVGGVAGALAAYLLARRRGPA